MQDGDRPHDAAQEASVATLADASAGLDPKSPAERDPDWSNWLDGRPRRLKRGKDYTGDPKPLFKRAREAAEGLGKLAVASRDSQGKYEYVWLQFVDGEVEPGRPCPVCGSRTLAKVQKHFLRCSRCASTLKATGGWDVEAGEYAPPSRSSGTVAWPGGDAEDMSGEDFAEILGARLLLTETQEIREPLVTQDFLLLFAVRFLRPIAAALPRVRLSVDGSGPLLRVQPPHPIEPSAGETVDARVGIPGNLLMPRIYSVEVVLLMVPDRARPTDYVRVTAADVLDFRVRKVTGQSLLHARHGSSPFTWAITTRENAPA